MACGDPPLHWPAYPPPSAQWATTHSACGCTSGYACQLHRTLPEPQTTTPFGPYVGDDPPWPGVPYVDPGAPRYISTTSTLTARPAPLTISDADIDRIADRVLERLDARAPTPGRIEAAAARVREVLRRIGR